MKLDLVVFEWQTLLAKKNNGAPRIHQDFARVLRQINECNIKNALIGGCTDPAEVSALIANSNTAHLFAEIRFETCDRSDLVRKVATAQGIPLDHVFYVGHLASEIAEVQRVGMGIITLGFPQDQSEAANIHKEAPDHMINTPVDVLNLARLLQFV